MKGKNFAVLKKYRLSFSLLSLAVLIVGILFLVMKENAFLSLASIFGALIVLVGGVMILTYLLKEHEKNSRLQLVLSIAVAALGLWIILSPGTFASLLSLVLGLYLILVGASIAQIGYSMREIEGKQIFSFIFGGVMVVLGLIMALNPFRAMAWFATFIGVVMILAGIIGLGTEIYLSWASKKIRLYIERTGGSGPIQAEYKDIK